MEFKRRIKQSFTQIPARFSANLIEADPDAYYPSEEPMSLSKRMLKVLTSPHSFLKHSRSGKRRGCSVYFSETLQKLSIDKPCAIYVLTTDIQGAEVDFSIQTKAIVGDSAKLIAFRVFTSNKVYEFSTDNRVLRDDFVKSLNTLVRLSKEYMSSMGLKKYCESIIHCRQGHESLTTLYKTSQQASERIDAHKESQESLERQIIQGVINYMISQVEISHKQYECNKLKILIRENTSERSKLSNKQDSLRNNISKKDQEIQFLKLNIKKVENQIEALRKPAYLPDSTIFSLKIWSCIIEFLKAADLVVLRTTCRSFRNATNRTLLNKHTWRRLCLSSLYPRKVMYRLYTRNFCKSELRGKVFEVDNDMAEEIHNDVWRGLNGFNTETEQVLLQLFKYNPNLSYCQGMHFVCHFLYKVYQSTEEVLMVMDSLCRPPYFLIELWKNDFSRLKLGIFQLDFLLKIRLPFFFKHLKDLEINLDMIVTPWFLTVFTYLHYQQELPNSVVLEIWDYFLTQGWPALISVCLSIFQLTEHMVIDTSLEQTLLILTTKIPYKDLHKALPKFEIDPRLLEDLEVSFLCSGLK